MSIHGWSCAYHRVHEYFHFRCNVVNDAIERALKCEPADQKQEERHVGKERGEPDALQQKEGREMRAGDKVTGPELQKGMIRNIISSYCTVQ